jgi:adhesin HecA-like repeat protein
MMRFRWTMVYLFCQLMPGYAATVSISPASLNVTPGQVFTVDIAVSDVTDLFAYGFDLGFDPSVLAAAGITEGPFLAAGGPTFFIPGSNDNTAGTVSATGNTLLTAITGVTGTGVLARATFNVVGAGNSSINLFGVTLLDSSLSGIPVNTQSGAVTAAVPEPSTLLSAAVALLLLNGRWWRV